MKIALCISGSFRESGNVVRENILRLISKGYSVSVFMHLDLPDSPRRLNFDLNPNSIWASIRPYRSFFVQNSNLKLDNLDEIDGVDQVIITYESRSIDEIVKTYGIEDVWHNLPKFQKRIPNTATVIRPYIPHFRNTLRMLSSMWIADEARCSSDSEFKIVIRLRPDFLMSDTFASTISESELVVPIRDSGRAFTYVRGHFSDMCFAGPPEVMRSLCSTVLELKSLWNETRIFVPESIHAPFMYGDVILDYRARCELGFTPKLVPGGGDLVRERTESYSIFNQVFWKTRRQYATWLKYNHRVLLWQIMSAKLDLKWSHCRRFFQRK